MLGTEPIHRWDKVTVVKGFLLGAFLEAILIAPLVLSPWGHAGPDSVWGLIGLLLNIPGLLALWLLQIISGYALDALDLSMTSLLACVYLTQTLIFSYVAFVWLRFRKRKGLVR